MNKVTILSCVLLGLISNIYAENNLAFGQEKTAACGACHGADGNSIVPNFPSLAGQAAGYLEKQITAFKSGSRKDSVMSEQAKVIEDTDIPFIAAYFASQKIVPNAATDAGLAAVGQRLFMGGNLSKGIPACSGCHGPTGKGNPAAKFPLLSGQQSMYVITQLQRFKTGERENEMMRGSVANMSEDEMKAVAEYISGLYK